MRTLLKKKDRYFWIAGAILLVGFAVRLAALGELPCGLNQDEAYAAYNAWSLLHYGVDSAGYRNPVYLVAWGSGMNALETYLMMPFIALFGTDTFVLRLPQALVACLSLVCVYSLGRRTLGRGFALCALAVLATSPWHVMMSRWALESNLAPGFLLFGLYFFVRGMSSPRWLYASAAAYGLSLYTYATIWPVMPLLLALQAAYAVRTKGARVRDMIGPLLLFVAMAIPLIWFLGVQMGYLPEVRTALLSIPKLEKFRVGELSIAQIWHNIAKAANILVRQEDALIWNYHDAMGLYFPFWLLPFVLGLVAMCVRFARCVRRRVFGVEGLILANLLAGGALCCLIEVNVNRMNALHIPILLCIAYGVYVICVGARTALRRQIRVGVALAYALCFAWFIYQYAFDYNDVIAERFHSGLRESLTCAQAERGAAPLHISREAYEPQVYLFLEKPPEEELPSDVTVGDLNSLPEGAAYVGEQEEVASLAEQGYRIEEFGEWAAALPPEP